MNIIRFYPKYYDIFQNVPSLYPKCSDFIQNFLIIGMLLQDEFDCIGGCPMNAFCDYGICRCRTGYDARYGQCWNRIESFNEHQNQWQNREMSDYNPYQSCSTHSECRKVDMNMVCKQDMGKCQCRDDMKWNEEGLECQVYIVRNHIPFSLKKNCFRVI